MNKKVFTIFLLGTALIPCGIAFAHPSVTAPQSTQDGYCLKVVVFEVENTRKMAEIRDANFAKEKEVTGKIEAIRKAQDEKIAEHKDKLEKVFSESVSQIGDKAVIEKLNSAHDQYVEVFEATIAEYRSAVNGAINARKEAFVAAESQFTNKVNQILTKTKADCDAKVDTQQIFKYLTTELKAAHATLVASIDTLSKSEVPVINRQRIAAAREKLNNDINSIIQVHENR